MTPENYERMKRAERNAHDAEQARAVTQHNNEALQDVIADAIARLHGGTGSRLDGEGGLAAATWAECERLRERRENAYEAYLSERESTRRALTERDDVWRERNEARAALSAAEERERGLRGELQAALAVVERQIAGMEVRDDGWSDMQRLP